MTTYKKVLALLALAASASTTFAAPAPFERCLEHFPAQVAPRVEGRAKLQGLCFNSFAVMHSGESKTPVFVVERLNRARLADAKGEERSDRFYAEARLPAAHRATLEDYKGSGFDRGHMAPAADMPNPEAMAQSFSLANMVPQASENNRGVWAKSVERATRKFVERSGGDVFVFTGPIFSGPVKTIGPGKVWVPTHLFKLVYDASSLRAWAYLVENKDGDAEAARIPYADLTQRLGIELLPGMSVKDLPRSSPGFSTELPRITGAPLQALKRFLF